MLDKNVYTCYNYGSDHKSMPWYGWRTNNQQKTPGRSMDKYGKRKCVPGDIIDMILDLQNNTLRYMVNDEDFGIAFKDIERTEYTTFVYMNWPRDSVELVSYQQIPHNQ